MKECTPETMSERERERERESPLGPKLKLFLHQPLDHAYEPELYAMMINSTIIII